MSNSSPLARKKVLHIVSGDMWAGAEAQAHAVLIHLKPVCDVSAVLMNEGESSNRLRACEIDVTIFDEATLSSWQIFKLLRAHIQLLKPDIIHTHRQKENILGASANFSTVRAKCIRTAHGASEFTSDWKTKRQRNIERWVTLYLHDVIISVSDELKEKLISDYPAEKVVVVYNGVDIEYLQRNAGISSFKRQQPEKRHIGIIGRIVPVKRVDIFLEAAASFKKDNIWNYQFHIVGDGPLESQFRSDAMRLGINDIVTFHGHISDIPSIINSLDAVVMCSDHEGLPMVALEAWALQTPLLITENLDFASAVQGNLVGTPVAHSAAGIANAIFTLPSGPSTSVHPPTAQECANKTLEIYLK